jgi:hypothetical protein
VALVSRMVGIAEIIKAEDPDVVGFQEVYHGAWTLVNLGNS